MHSVYILDIEIQLIIFIRIFFLMCNVKYVIRAVIRFARHIAHYHIT